MPFTNRYKQGDNPQHFRKRFRIQIEIGAANQKNVSPEEAFTYWALRAGISRLITGDKTGFI